MFKKFKFNKLLLFIPLTSLIFCFNSPQEDEEKMKTIMVSVRNTLSYLHYSPKPINDSYSIHVYNKYMEMIDYGKMYFQQADLDEFAKHKNMLDDYLNKGDLQFFNLTIDRLYKRIELAEITTKEIFSQSINLDEDDFITLEYKSKKTPLNEKEWKKEWKKYIKYNILQEINSINSREEIQKKKKDSVQKNGLKDTIKLINLSEVEKYNKARNEVKEALEHSFARYKKRKKIDWFTVYMNAYTEVFDPHTNYFSPSDKDEFDVNFTGKVIGIGAIIQEKKGNLYLGALSVGAPAWKSKQLSEGDRILKVKSMPNKEAVNVVGMLSSEAVKLIRGKLGTQVTLTVEKKDKTIKEVTMIREEVEMEDTFAKSIIIKDSNGKNYGLINLPSFNAEFEKVNNGRNASDDVKKEILKLKEHNIEGIILDLRYNGGGSLTEVGDIMGLFMNAGPYVQVKDRNGKIQTLKNKNNSPIWTGPLLIMQNEYSASASEILAGAIQDYGRGVVIGSPQSFGKGTVQTFVELNRFLNTADDFGALKLTIQKFYRITGESTQKKGINADFEFKNPLSYSEVGERYDDYSLEWDQIAPVSFEKVSQRDYVQLKKNSQKRIANNKTYQLILELAKFREEQDKVENLPLQKKKFFEYMATRKKQFEKFENINKYNNSLEFIEYAKDLERKKSDEAFAKKSENWIKTLKKDLLLQECIEVIKEL